jgi:hypothetical protein
VVVRVEPALGEPLPQPLAGIVQRLVESAAIAAEALGEDVDRDAVERDRDQHLALTGGEAALDLLAQGRDQLA